MDDETTKYLINKFNSRLSLKQATNQLKSSSQIFPNKSLINARSFKVNKCTPGQPYPFN